MTDKKGFTEGWAKRGVAGTPHYFRRLGVGLARSLCGAQDAPSGWLSPEITSQCCERCAKLRDKELSKSNTAPPEAAKDERYDRRMSDGKAGD
ncbi:hypothetical protein MesoLj131c_62450 [Mesorhizobium sp. 131-3-5]|uniref:hypothetical protein n=1 Tax=Mesorhizobium sp. 131-3-5 TaxID=2744520 RepID=UPI0019252178|nr:hypothetical protein [Mesorhizobium sp. 131-3-5]BCH11987.1 hypothetical protein MesoLj131c_62450 [Mesorhizobium sp. 131-3-5]